MSGSAEHECDAAAGQAASPESISMPAQAGLQGMRSEGDLRRALAGSDPRVLATLARSVQATAGNRAVQQLAAESRRLQRYTDATKEGDWKGVTPGSALGRVSETGETFTRGTQEAWATAELIEKADGILQMKESGVHLFPTNDAPKLMDAPDGSAQKTLRRIGVQFKRSPEGKISGDCREAALEVAGHGPDGGPEKLTITEAGRRVEIEGENGSAQDAAVRAMLVDKKVHDTPNYSSLDDAARQKLHKEAQKDVGSMSNTERQDTRGMAVDDARAKEIGIDVYANPGVGDAYTAVKGPPAGQGEFRAHFAAVIMAPGNDRVTLENEGEARGVANANWLISTYSLTEPRKTFHREHPSLTKPGHTFVVRTGPTPPEDAAKILRMTTPDLVTRFLVATADEKPYIEKELLKRSINVLVTVDHTEDDDEDEVLAEITSGSKSASTGRVNLRNGQSGTLVLPLAKIWPLGKDIVVDIQEHDWATPNDHIGALAWASPFLPSKEMAMAHGTAKYRVVLKMNK